MAAASNLDIPNDAIQAYLAIDDDFDSDEAVIDAMLPIVAPVVAAELRRLADWHWDDNPVARAICSHLVARADELDPQ